MRAVARRLVLVLSAASLLAACGQKGGTAAVGADEMVMGKADAPVTMIEYASVTCPHCARWNQEVFPAFRAKYIDTGLVRYVFREFLTPPTPVAAAGFLLARCAGKDKYFSVLDALFYSQNEIYQSGDPRSVLFRIGQSVGLTDQQINACMSDEKAIEALQKRVDAAINVSNIQATPTFLIGDKKLEGEQSLAALDAVIQPLLKK